MDVYVIEYACVLICLRIHVMELLFLNISWVVNSISVYSAEIEMAGGLYPIVFML